MRFLGLFVIVAIGCGGSVAPATTDAAVDGEDVVDTRDAAPPDTRPATCSMPNPIDPPIGCGPAASGAPACSSTKGVETCPTDTACMATVKQTDAVRNHRIGRLRIWAPMPLLSLTPIVVDPNISARCANGGSETFNWLLRFSGTTLRTGPARPTTGTTYTFMDETFTGTSAASICPGFVGPSAPLPLRAESTSVIVSGVSASTAPIPALNATIFDSTGMPLVLPLRDVRFKFGNLSDPNCVGSWNKNYWCDGDTLGWTDGGSIVAKISVEDADRVPIRSAGCQSLCAILVNDATKTEGKACKRGSDGKVLAKGDACISGEGCNDAWLFSATFSSYGVNIAP